MFHYFTVYDGSGNWIKMVDTELEAAICAIEYWGYYIEVFEEFEEL